MLDLVLDALAAYRLTRLVTADVLTAPYRDRIVEASYVAQGRGEMMRPSAPVLDGEWSQVAMDDDAPPRLATLVTCRFCAGMYVALGVVAARRLAPRLWSPLARALAFSAAAALLAGLEDD